MPAPKIAERIAPNGTVLQQMTTRSANQKNGQKSHSPQKKTVLILPLVVNCTVTHEGPIPTRASLLQRLKDLGDQSSWDEFYEIYHDLIFSVARRAGLGEQEAREVVQDTLISVARKMPGFTYDPAKDSFKGWLLTVTRWRIRDQFAKRVAPDRRESAASHDEEEQRTATIDGIPDPTGSALAAIWQEEWETRLMQTALARIRRQVRPQYYQIYHLHVVLGQSAREVAQALGVNATQIYLAKHRVANLLKKEVKRLAQAPQ
jgi:RNA polymerase sigma-70 factor (ECF subfamily)